MRVLVVEDEVQFGEFLKQRLTEEKYVVELARDEDHTQRLIAEHSYDLLILTADLPGIDGLELLRRIRSAKPDLPVLIVTDAANPDDRVRGLDAGADDYIAKPFEFVELAARIRAVLRRGDRSAQAVLTVNDLTLDRMNRNVQRAGRTIDLSRREFALLEFLMCNAGKAVSRATLLQAVWKFNSENDTNVVDVYISYLRRKVDDGESPALIRTIRGIGYQIGQNGLCGH
jgi:DNA-binding response OmpR family regulator